MRLDPLVVPALVEGNILALALVSHRTGSHSDLIAHTGSAGVEGRSGDMGTLLVGTPREQVLRERAAAGLVEGPEQEPQWAESDRSWTYSRNLSIIECIPTLSSPKNESSTES